MNRPTHSGHYLVVISQKFNHGMSLEPLMECTECPGHGMNQIVVAVRAFFQRVVVPSTVFTVAPVQYGHPVVESEVLNSFQRTAVADRWARVIHVLSIGCGCRV